MRKGFMAVAAVLMMASAVSAQSVHGSASIHVPSLLTFNVTNTTVTFNDPTFADFDAGLIGASSLGSVISTRGNVPHVVQIAADAATMTYTGSETLPSPKSASDLQWATDGSTWSGLSTTDTDVATYTRGAHADATTVTYQMLLDIANDYPGDYSLAFTYTILAN